jgi:hypothetical protein
MASGDFVAVHDESALWVWRDPGVGLARPKLWVFLDPRLGLARPSVGLSKPRRGSGGRGVLVFLFL